MIRKQVSADSGDLSSLHPTKSSDSKSAGMTARSYRKPKTLFPAAAAWINEPPELPPVAPTRAQSSSLPRRANLYSKPETAPLKVESRVGAKFRGADSDSIKFLCDMVKRPRDLRRWQPGYQVTPRTAMTRSPRYFSRNIIQIEMNIDDLRFRRPLKKGPWDGLVRKQEQSSEENGSIEASYKSEAQISGGEPREKDDDSGLVPIVEKGGKKEEPIITFEPEAQLKNDKETARLAVFKRLHNDGDIDIDNLMEALELLNFPRPNQTWVYELAPTLTEARLTVLNQSEFLAFCNLYDERQRMAYEDEFYRFDEDGSGEVDATELGALLEGFGVTPLPGVLEENIAEVDKDGTGKLNVQEFVMVLELQWDREGFTKSEVEEFQKAFRKFDRDHSNEVSANELLGILSWLGYPQRAETVYGVIKKADADGTGDLSWTEMLSCMRWLREAEVTHVQKLLKKYDSDGSGEVDRQELLSLLSELGYTANHEAIQNAVEDAKLKANDENFDFNELWRLLHVFRRRCGFTRNEDKDIIAAHGRYDHKNEGMISTLELGKALRLLGYSVAVPTQKKLLEQVDVDGSGRLDLAEFRTLMRMQREDELSEMKDIFRHYANKEDKVSAADLPRALRRAGCLQPDGSIPAETTKVVKNLPGGIDFDTFWKIVSSQFKASRERMRESAGFTAPEVANFKKMFIDFDADGGGDIKGAELRALMRCIFPDVGMTMGDRKLMEQILNDVDQDGSGSLDFADFLRLMRHYHDEHDRKQLENMWEGFTDEEARQFKGIFDSEDIRKTGHLPPNQVVAMIQRICPMGTEALGELTKLLTEVRNGSSNVDFTAFLRVMRHIIDVDLAGINGHAARVTEAKAMPF